MSTRGTEAEVEERESVGWFECKGYKVKKAFLTNGWGCCMFCFSVFTSSSYVDFDLELRKKRVIQTHHCHLSLIPQAYAGVTVSQACIKYKYELTAAVEFRSIVTTSLTHILRFWIVHS